MAVRTTAARTTAAAAAPPFRFSRMGPQGPAVGRRDPQEGRPGDDRRPRSATGEIPAGYTYLGQFVDHDLTFDATTVAFGETCPRPTCSRAARRRSTSTRLYGAGPLDPESAKFYEADRLHLKMGRTTESLPDKAMDGFDLPRVGKGSAANRRKALIPDRRNDENLAVAQHHLAMIRFHNRVVDKLPAVDPGRRQVQAGAGDASCCTTSGCCAPTTSPGSATPRSWTTCSPTGARSSRSAPTR